MKTLSFARSSGRRTLPRSILLVGVVALGTSFGVASGGPAEVREKTVSGTLNTLKPSVRRDTDPMLNTAIELGTKLIAKYGSHIPFCVVLTITGEETIVGVDDTVEHRAVVLESQLREAVLARINKGELRAVAFAKNVQYKSAIDKRRVDAIQISVDHIEGYASTCYLPYKVSKGTVIPGEVFATEPVETFFKASDVVNPPPANEK